MTILHVISYALGVLFVVILWFFQKPRYLTNRLRRLFGDMRSSNIHEDVNKPLFIIFNPTWPDPPREGYTALSHAVADAQVLAKKQPGDTFYILKAVQVLTSKPIIKELPVSDS